MLKARRMAMLASLCLGTFGLGALTARAELDGAVLSAARTMLDLPEDWLGAAPRTLALNGARVQIMSGRSELAMGALLDHLEARCREHDGGVGKLLARASKAPPAQFKGLLDGVLRVENEGEGVVACLQLGSADLGWKGLTSRLSRFARTLDLNDLGGIRMVRVSRREHGSFFVVAASQGPASLTAMFPDGTDAPGHDAASLPRPTGSIRLLSAWQIDGAPSLNAYRVPRALSEVWAEQVASLQAAGWSLLDSAPAQSRSRHGLLVWREGSAALLTAHSDGQETLLTVMPLQAGPAAVRDRR